MLASSVRSRTARILRPVIVRTVRPCLFAVAIAVAVAGCGKGGGGKKKHTQPAAPTERWTVMVYMAGDNDLEDAAIADLEEMEQVGSDDNLHVLVQVDTHARNIHGSTTAKRMRIAFAPQPGIDSPVLDDLGEIAMSDETQLIAFVEWCTTNFPADRYALVLWDHGAGWPGALLDESAPTPNDLLDLDELELALRTLQSRTGVSRLDLIGFDACLMATLELATTIAPYARILVASEEIEPGSGWAYDRWLASFAGAPERTAATLGSAIAQTYMDSLAGSPCHAAATMSVIDLDQIVPLAAAVDAIALDLASLDDATILAQVTPARRSAVEFDQRSAVEPGDLVDLGHFARRLQQEVLDPAVRTRLDRVLSRLQDAVIVSVAGSEKQGASGLSIYMPVLLSTPYNGYDRTLFAVTNRWFDFVERYRDAVRTDVTRPSLAVASLSPPNRVVTPATPLQVTVGTNDPDVYRLVGMVMYYNGSWYIVDGVDFTGSSSLGWSGDIPLLTDGSRASFLPLLPVAPGNGLSVVAAQLGPERSLGFLLFDRDPTSAQVRFAGAFHSPDGASVGIYPLTDGTPVRVLLPSYNAGTGRWSFTVSPVTVTYGPGFQVVADAQPGTYQLLLLAEDHAGNWGGTAVTGISRP